MNAPLLATPASELTHTRPLSSAAIAWILPALKYELARLS
jgi:hypothetical protein